MLNGNPCIEVFREAISDPGNQPVLNNVGLNQQPDDNDEANDS
jgi:hypothetical protein